MRRLAETFAATSSYRRVPAPSNAVRQEGRPVALDGSPRQPRQTVWSVLRRPKPKGMRLAAPLPLLALATPA